MNDNTKIKAEKIIDDMVQPALDLSPFERYIYAYNIVKNFKAYNEHIDREMQSEVYQILFNEYIVCTGFRNLLSELLTKLDIPNKSINIKIANIQDFANSQEALKKRGHARLRVKIVDQKYGIDGFYICDPTWDNDLERDYYTHLLMTNRKETYSFSYVWLNDGITSELYDINSIDEFRNKINYLFIKKSFPINLLLIQLCTELYLFDQSYLDPLTQKYNLDLGGIMDAINKFDDDQLKEISDDIGNVILSKVNKEVDGYTIMAGVAEIYKKFYGYQNDEELNKALNEVVRLNKERYELYFPKRYNTTNDGKKELYDNPFNPFDIVLEEVKKL